MPEHFHLLISEPQEVTPSTVIQAVKLGFVQRLPTVEAFGPRNIWQRRFYDFNVWTEDKRGIVIRALCHICHAERSEA